MVAFRILCREDESINERWSKPCESRLPAKKAVVAYQVSVSYKTYFWHRGFVVAVCLKSSRKAKLAGSSVLTFQDVGVGEAAPV